MSGFDDDDDDDDSLEEDGGSFADNDDSFDDGGPNDEDEGQEGNFRDVDNTFSTPQSQPAQHANRLTNQAEEDAEYETPKPNALQRAKAGDGVLVAKWFSTDAGDFKVAWAIDNKLVESWRTPSAAEFEKFKAQGKWLKGGVRKVGEVATVAAAPAGIKGFFVKHKKKILVGTGLLAAAGGGWWLYKKYKAEADGSVEDSR